MELSHIRDTIRAVRPIGRNTEWHTKRQEELPPIDNATRPQCVALVDEIEHTPDDNHDYQRPLRHRPGQRSAQCQGAVDWLSGTLILFRVTLLHAENLIRRADMYKRAAIGYRFSKRATITIGHWK